MPRGSARGNTGIRDMLFQAVLADSATGASLPVRLRNAPRDQAAWRQFVQGYGSQIYGWCRHWKLRRRTRRT